MELTQSYNRKEFLNFIEKQLLPDDFCELCDDMYYCHNNIKSIVTLILTIVFAILSLRGVVTPEVFISVFTVIIGFYFGTQKIDDTSKSVTYDEDIESIDKKNETNI